jgi:hypothetical protein
MQEHKRDFKGVWIPKEIWLSKDLSLFEKVLFVEIHSLDNERGCFASNQHFGRFLGVSDRQIRRYISRLEKKHYINVTIKNRNERTMRVAGKYARHSDERLHRVEEMKQQIREKMRRL